MNNNEKLMAWLNTKLILGLCIIIAASIGAYVFYQARGFENSLSVTGSATKDVTSDHVKWVGVITRATKVATLKTGYATLASDLAIVQEFLKSNGITDAEIDISPVSMEPDWDLNQQNVSASEKSYNLKQTIEINSANVDAITNLSKHTSPLIDKGVVFTTQTLEYTYTKLADERIALLSDAMADAKARAGMLAESTGKKVGKLKSASSGVVQVLSENSLNVSDYGSYDTSKVKKTIMITVKAAFTLE